MGVAVGVPVGTGVVVSEDDSDELPLVYPEDECEDEGTCKGVTEGAGAREGVYVA